MCSHPAAAPGDPLAELITTYNELNGAFIEELAEEPSPLEFMRYVARNTPFVVRGAASSWQSNQTWDKEYLVRLFKGQAVNVAVTPFGNADAPTDHDGKIVFAKPHEEDQDFEEFINYVINQEKSKDATSEVRYAQTQNDNLRNEYFPLSHQVPPSVPFARIALDRDPEAVNLWIGTSRSVTALHKDNYENIYVQIRGCKHFVLLPPCCQPCVNERTLMPATYARRDLGGLALELDEASNENKDRPEDGALHGVPFATWDPDHPDTNATPYSHLAEPVRVTLEPGDMLYLPAMWYHKVSQSCPEDGEGFVLAVNYWYDMEFSGPLYPLSSFVRNIGLQTTSTVLTKSGR
ncbi:phospholipase A2 [Colletotrichum higginsianum]|uniref:Phospholipase A2 n=3 Tax=Colletotrichum higginsianum TaxID=80884 RepID=H1UXZ9_COLHI|nr:JmjC domain-containing protein 7 [Colletotrichum higginsianum]CCF32850.1 phospholipase A2 [Colletotrichum higginsianum]